ncbi:MAG: tRNA pseudouridine(38-40) synthase TruA [Deltaproteobacteria bacterium]|nr:tRNA pseudouridine(38-40) synthase TruA [Deltaproteobacteria bacterium]
MTRNLKVILEYDGSRYHGWQRQREPLTIQQVLEECINRITGEDVRVNASGRTDAGVHAMNQVANFRTQSNLDTIRLCKGINSLLPKDIVIKELAEVSDSFHARFDVKSKVYMYQLFNNPVRPVLCRLYTWPIYKPLNLESMKKAAGHLLGCHDFSSFCGTGCDMENRVRTVMSAEITSFDSGLIRINVEADGFLRYMIRNIVGTLIDVGRGKRLSDEIPGLIAAKDRRRAGMTAPAQGLFLKEVKY